MLNWILDKLWIYESNSKFLENYLRKYYDTLKMKTIQISKRFHLQLKKNKWMILNEKQTQFNNRKNTKLTMLWYQQMDDKHKKNTAMTKNKQTMISQRIKGTCSLPDSCRKTWYCIHSWTWYWTWYCYHPAYHRHHPNHFPLRRRACYWYS